MADKPFYSYTPDEKNIVDIREVNATVTGKVPLNPTLSGKVPVNTEAACIVRFSAALIGKDLVLVQWDHMRTQNMWSL